MNIILGRKAERYLDKLNQPDKGRILSALKNLEKEPPQGDIKPLSGSGNFRARVGNYRIIFIIECGVISILDIAPRGQVYKGL